MGSRRVTEVVRASRDGDQFHYHWGARQALRLLGEGERPVAITVEGGSELDSGSDGALQAIDLAEYWGSEDPQRATQIIYRQFKHSTLQSSDEWTASFLKDTIVSFAKKYREAVADTVDVAEKVRFEFITNRPAQADVKAALRQVATATHKPGNGSRKTPATYLWEWAAAHLSTEGVPQFYARFSIHDAELPLRDLRVDLIERTGAFLPGAPADQPLRLKELVEQCATNLASTNVIRRQSVLVALGVTEEDLLPAPCELTRPATIVVPPSWPVIRDSLLGGSAKKVVVHASGGMGKSVFAGWLPENLPDGWVGVVFDCFANGTYRSVSAQRHEHRRALVQISNELAARMLCTPVIPSASASPSHYMRTFRHRLEQANEALTQQHGGASLVLIVDAADSSVLAAHSQGSRSFAPDLLREDLPAGVVLVMLARTERVRDLDVPPDCVLMELGGFSSLETALLLESRFTAASQADSEEFHLQTGGVPRVQAMVLDGAESLSDALRSLGEAREPGTDILDSLLAGQVAKARDLLHDRADATDRLCRAMATLPPRIPVAVLSALTDLPESAVASFATDVGRSLLVSEGHLQFRDEPTETWFRMQFGPASADIPRFLDVLAPLATTQPYVAGALPQLMLEGGQFGALVSLALGEEGLPDASDSVKLEVKRNRTQLAVKAALRSQRWFDAARLALRAGTLEAGRGRRHSLIRGNSDLAGEFLPDEVLNSLLATRALADGWPGSNLHVEASLLAHSNQRALARTKLRSATEWMFEWLRSSSRRDYDDVTFDDIAEIAVAVLRVAGASACAEYMRRWRSPALHYQVGLLLGRRLATKSGALEISNLVEAGRDLRPFVLGLARVAFEVGITPTQPATDALCDLLKKSRTAVNCGIARWAHEVHPLGGVVWAVAHGLARNSITSRQAKRVLDYYLPVSLPYSASGSYRSDETAAALYGHALLSRLEGSEFDPWTIASPTLREEREKQYVSYESVRTFNENILPLTRWVHIHLRAILACDETLDPELSDLMEITFRPKDYHGGRPYLLIGWGARIASSLVRLGLAESIKDGLVSWCLDPRNQVASITRTAVIERLCGVQSCAAGIVQLAEVTAADIEDSREDAGERANELVMLARAVYRFSSDEAKAYFDKALAIADRMGDEVWERWQTQLMIARSMPSGSDATRAYRLGQIAESLEPYLGDAQDWRATVKAIGHLHSVSALAIVSRWRTRRAPGRWSHISALTDPDGWPLASNALACLGLVALDDSAGVGPILQAAVASQPAAGPAIQDAVRQFEHHRLTGRNGDTQDDSQTPNWRDDDETKQRRAAATDSAYHALDLTSVAGWEQAQDASRTGRSLDRDRLVTLAMTETPLAQLASVVRAFRASSWPTIYTYDFVFKRLEQRQPMPQAARGEARELALEAASRFCLDLTATYRTLDLDCVNRLTGVSPLTLIERALGQVGHLPRPLTAVEHLHLTRSLADLLSAPEIAQLFDYSSQQFEELAPIDALDGLLEAADPLPAEISQALAALVWVGLADPAIADRWRAAHVVYRWAVLGCRPELESLAILASSKEPPRAFIDRRLPFYRLHAIEWLLFGLARAALREDSVRSVAPFRGVLLDILLRQPPHAVIQTTARDIIRHWREAGDLDLDQVTYDQVMTVCQPIGVINTGIDDSEAGEGQSADERAMPEGETTDSILWDFGDYWCRPLGEVFGLNQHAVLRLVHEAIALDRGGRRETSLEDDPRRTLKLYADETSAYHGEWPAEDDLAFYHGVHGHYRVAGQLVASRLVVKGRFTDSDEPFRDWLRDHLVSRADGRWLADRRDAPPLDRRSIDDRGYNRTNDPWLDSTNWPDPWCRIQHGEFLTVHESSTTYSLYHREHLSVVSALVDPETSIALLRALREPSNAGGLYTMDPHDRWERSRVGKKFEPWRLIVLGNYELGMDKHDPHANGVRFPPPRLAPFVIKDLDLTPDLDERYWVDSASLLRVRTTVWNDLMLRGRDQEGPEGDRIELHAGLLLEVLRRAQRDLVVQVTVTRGNRNYYTGRDDDDRERRISYYFLVRTANNRLFVS